jgi:hypothetical protein
LELLFLPGLKNLDPDEAKKVILELAQGGEKGADCLATLLFYANLDPAGITISDEEANEVIQGPAKSRLDGVACLGCLVNKEKLDAKKVFLALAQGGQDGQACLRWLLMESKLNPANIAFQMKKPKSLSQSWFRVARMGQPV